MSYQDTSLWKRTLGKDDPNVEPLKNSFLRAREHAEFLLGKIRKDFPNLTVHDITHVDSLWNVADTIIGPNYPINPLEGYILGISFLIHDAALSYDTVGGIGKLRDTIQWQDAYADGPGDKKEEEFKKECDFAAIRALHAKYAEDIPTQTYKDNNGNTFYILENDDYRTYFGELIGLIAASHHWSIDDVELKLDSQVNPIAEVPGDWEINAQKLACILRCADAGHIDNGRAPYNIYRSLSVNGVSRNHWESQIHLGQIRPNKKDSGKLLITSIKSFKKEEFAAWNVAYDAVRIFDEELKKSNELLKSINEDLVFPFIGVSGANSKEELAEYIKTEGWQPCNFGVHTSNIKLLIENLGGTKLYGEDNILLIVLRELIQNARDAIHARQHLDDTFDNGKITIRLKEVDAERFIEVEDNGIGMSMDCIKHNLLDFGSSYWKSSLSKYENPGLRSKGFTSIGKFGIGFYSVFMVAKSVEVRTKRYDKAVNDAKRIEFPSGLTLSPIISEDNTLNASVSTIVRFELPKDDDNCFFGTGEYFFQHILDLKEALPIIVAGLDVDVFYEEKGHMSIIHTSIESSTFDKKVWLRNLLLDESDLINVIDEIADSLEFIEDNKGKKRGLIGVPNEILLQSNFPSIETINGLCTSLKKAYSLNLFLGYISSCKCSSISRNEMALDIDLQTTLQKWIKRKYLENHDEIYKSINLSNYYVKMMDYCGITQEDKLILLEQNKKNLYKTYKSRNLKIGTFSGLKEIQSFLFSGIINDSEMPDTLRRFASVKRYYSLESLITKIDTLGINDFDEVFSKFIELCHAIKLDRGEKYVAPKVWLNLMLNECMNRMIDWSIVDQDELDLCIANLNHPDERDHLRTIINEHLIDGTLLGEEKFC